MNGRTPDRSDGRKFEVQMLSFLAIHFSTDSAVKQKNRPRWSATGTSYSVELGFWIMAS
jgi:hypothetical protein